MADGVRTAVAGVGGYSGGELARLLLAHPRLRHTPPLLLGRAAEEGGETYVALEHMHPQLGLGGGKVQPRVDAFSWDLVQERGIELVFLALPHEASRESTPKWLARGIKVIDLSGAWRLNDPANAAVYKLTDADPALAVRLQAEAVYGAPELHAAEIATARLVANPGCYSTSIILALAPLLRAGLVDLKHGIVCDAKSGISGAGRTPTAKTHFMYGANNLSAYSVFGHRHTGELLEQLHLLPEQIQFTPHLLPIPRGILSTLYVRLKRKQDVAAIESILRAFYENALMVRVRAAGNLPDILSVAHTSYCDLGFVLAPDGQRLVLVSCLDNLLKGAAGQAVQNMNLMCGYEESEGLL